MRAYLVLVRRELSGYFIALTGYVIIAAVLLLLGVSFTVMLLAYNNESLHMPLTELFYGTMFFWLILLVAAPVVTMRLFAQEKFAGTFETLMTTPVGDLEVVLAKFTAALAFYGLTWAPLLVCLWLVHASTAQGSPFDWGTTSSTLLGVLLIGSLYVAMGTLASALTRSQIIAAMTSFALGVTLFLLSFLKYSLGTQRGWLAQAVNHVSMLNHMEDFVRGVVDTRPLIFYATATAFFLFLTLKVVESRRWK